MGVFPQKSLKSCGWDLFALSSLMPCAGQEFSVLVFSHFFSSFFYDTAQQITSSRYFLFE
jgi:hypothetical protein